MSWELLFHLCWHISSSIKCRHSPCFCLYTDWHLESINYVYENTCYAVYWLHQQIQNSTAECTDLSPQSLRFICITFLSRNEILLEIHQNLLQEGNSILKSTNNNPRFIFKLQFLDFVFPRGSPVRQEKKTE